MEKTKRRTLDHREAAGYLGIADQTLYNWRSQERGPDYIRLGRKIAYLRSDLDKFLENNRIILSDIGE